MPQLRSVLALVPLLATTACGFGAQAVATPAAREKGPAVELRLRDPGDSGALALARKDGSLDRALAAVHAKAVWTGGSPTDFGEALHQLDSGAVDIAAGNLADAVLPLTGHPAIRLFGVGKPDLMGEGVLVKNTAGLRTVNDLAGRRIALQHGGTSEYLLLKALQKNGVPPDRVGRVYLDPAAANRAFRAGEVDGWAVTGPPVLPALSYADAHFVASGRGMDSDNYRVWAVRRAMIDQHPEVVRAFYRYLHGAMVAAQADPAASLDVFTDSGPQAVPADQRDLAVDLGRGTDPIGAVTEADTVRMERLAQLFADQHLTPAPVALRPYLVDVDSLPERAR